MSRKTSVIFNTREQGISSDFNRVQKLWNKALMNVLYDGSRSDYHRTGVGSANVFTTQGTPRNVLQRAPTWTPDNASYDVAIGEGEARLIQAPGADDPNYAVVQWALTTLTFGAPDAALTRIDTVYATPGDVDADPSLRVILQDPAAGTTAPAIVNKTKNPSAVLAIAAGTPNANPHSTQGVAPGNTLPLFTVVIPPGVAAADDFLVSRAIERPHYEVEAAAHGLIQGISMDCTGPSDESGAATPIPSGAFGSSGSLVRAVVNGKLLVGFCGGATDTLTAGDVMAGILVDSAADPFAGVDAVKDVPYYVYLVPSVGQAGPYTGPSGASPFVLIESLTPPDDSGRPSVGLIGPDGNVQVDALYVGLGWKARGQTYRKSFYWDGDDWCWAGSSASAFTYAAVVGFGVFDEDGSVGSGGRRAIPAANSGTDFLLATTPAVPHRGVTLRAKVRIVMVTATADEQVFLYQGTYADGHAIYNDGDALVVQDIVDVPRLPATGQMAIGRGAAGAGAPAVIGVCAIAYKMGVNRLSSAH